MDGVEEERAVFASDARSEFGGLRRYRRFGPDGPMYEVLAVSADTVRVHVFDNGEEFDYRVDRALNDPVAR